MTREEQRIKQIEQFASKCYDDGGRYVAFISGAIWADSNPDTSSLWHDAYEIPQKQRNLLLIDKRGGAWTCDFCDRLDNPDGWGKYVKKESLIRWAYVDDLLPKGGKNE